MLNRRRRANCLDTYLVTHAATPVKHVAVAGCAVAARDQSVVGRLCLNITAVELRDVSTGQIVATLDFVMLRHNLQARVPLHRLDRSEHVFQRHVSFDVVRRSKDVATFTS